MSKKKNIKIEDLKQRPITSANPLYFESLEKAILKNTVQREDLKIKLREQLIVNQVSREPLFQVQVNYFTELENAIAARTYDLEAEPAFVKIFESKFSRENIFEVPEGYFNWLPQRTAEKRPVTLPGNENAWQWSLQKGMSGLYAVAASLILIFSISITVYLTENMQLNTANALKDVSSNEILAYMNSVEVDAEDIHLEKIEGIHLPEEVNLHKELENIDYQDIVDIDEL